MTPETGTAIVEGQLIPLSGEDHAELSITCNALTQALLDGFSVSVFGNENTRPDMARADALRPAFVQSLEATFNLMRAAMREPILEREIADVQKALAHLFADEGTRRETARQSDHYRRLLAWFDEPTGFESLSSQELIEKAVYCVTISTHLLRGLPILLSMPVGQPQPTN